MMNSMEEDMEFTPREKHLIHYYKDSKLYKATAWKQKLYEAIWIVAAVPFGIVSWYSGDLAWGATAVGIVFCRLANKSFRGMAFSDELARMIRKYEARIESLEKTNANQESGAS